jgi:hypothetical protein
MFAAIGAVFPELRESVGAAADACNSSVGEARTRLVEAGEAGGVAVAIVAIGVAGTTVAVARIVAAASVGRGPWVGVMVGRGVALLVGAGVGDGGCFVGVGVGVDTGQ